MLRKKTLPKVLLFLAALVFFSANTVYILEAETKAPLEFDKTVHLNFDTAIKGPYTNLKSAIIVNYDNGNVLYSKNANTVRPVASLSKLVTAMVVIDAQLPLDSIVEISKQDARNSSKSRLRSGYKLTVLDLMHASLLSSDNRAARALARATSGSYDKFAKLMNRKMKELSLAKSYFVEPTGLSKQNVSTAAEMAKIMHYANDYNLIRKITSKKSKQIKIQNRKNKTLQMPNTNMIVHSPYKVLSGKTGYIQAADYCLSTLVKNRKGERLTCVVLGVPGDKLRFREARKLIDWAYRQI